VPPGTCPARSAPPLSHRDAPLSFASDGTARPVRRSFCRFCHVVCGIEVDVEDGRVLAVRGGRDHVVSQGYLCVKGRELAEQHTHPSRLRGAKKRTPDGTFVDVARRIERTMRVFALRAY
jgi:anaerobic selenocysteine-containing dehydrogenase